MSVLSVCDCVLTHVNNEQRVKVTRSLQPLLCQEKAGPRSEELIHNGNVVNTIMRSREIAVKLNRVYHVLSILSTIFYSILNLKTWIYSLHCTIIQESWHRLNKSERYFHCHYVIPRCFLKLQTCHLKLIYTMKFWEGQ